jgi:hypothetical protein
VDEKFFNIVISLSQSALVGMGKISNPQTGKVEKNMDLVRVNIDILQMLKEKTKGNLAKKEKEILTDTLTNLQLTFVDEQKKDSNESNKKEENKDLKETKKPNKKEDSKDSKKSGKKDK